MSTLIIYVLDSAPGDTLEDKVYDCIAGGYLQSMGFDSDLRDPAMLREVKSKFSIVAAARKGFEWEVTIEGSEADIADYQRILERLE